MKLLLILALIPFILAKEVPPGLRPAKAVDDPEKPIVPKLEQAQEQQQLDEESIEPTQSARLTARQNKKGNSDSAASSQEKDEKIGQNEQTAATNEKPLIFQKTGKGKRRLSPVTVGAGTQVVQQVIKPNPEQQEAGTSVKPLIRTIPPPAGKDYGVNTLLQTNLVDSKGRVLKGVNSVPIPVPDIRNAKASRASASRVETEAEKPVQINFSG